MMRRFVSFISLLMIVLSVFWFTIHDAQAKRFGGGRSFGVQRSVSGFSRQPLQYMQANNQAGQQRSFGSKWLGPLAGFAAGGLLASLLMHNGIGSGLLVWLGVGFMALLLINFFRKKAQTSAPYASSTRNVFNGEFSREHAREHASDYMAKDDMANTSGRHPFLQSNSSQMNSSHTDVKHYPVGFDADTLIRDAKVQFIRMQTAYDAKNLQDIRDFTTPEVFAEIQLQIHERGNENNQTVVVSLDAELLDVATEPSFMRGSNEQRTMASVRFSGKIRENHDGEMLLNETWHFLREPGSSRWLVSGVQQA